MIFFLYNFLFSYNIAIAIEPDTVRYYNLGDTYCKLGKKKEALERLILILFNNFFSFKNCWKLN